jgi:VIT1/CCC1 family predicted Fe2+/Mn2+ transporter
VTNHQLRDAFGAAATFGLTSGVITTLGLLVGLASGTRSRGVIIGGIVTIAIADAFSDALGMHLHEESEGEHTDAEIWVSTFATLITKFLMASTFLVPLLYLDLTPAIQVSLVWGALVLTLMSYRMAKAQGQSPTKVILEHVFIAALVVLATHWVGIWVGARFGV